MKDKKPAKKKSKRVRLEGITSHAWEHPADRMAMKSLQKVPGLDVALKAILGGTSERSIRLIALASSVRVNDKQFPHVHKLFQECCHILDVQGDFPELYVSQNPFLNAGAIGWDRPFITLNSAMLQTLDDEELMCVMGHELGHILSGHVLYKTLLLLMMQISVFLVNIPLSGLAIAGLIAALKEWDRKSELSADRAGLLTVQNPEVSVSLLMKMAGGNQTDQMNLGEFVKQAEEYNNADGLLDNVYKLMSLLSQTHPFPVLRVSEILNWVRTGDYDNILNKNYSAGEGSVGDDFVEASQGYNNDFKESFGKNVKDARQKAKDFYDAIFNQDR